MSAQFNSGHKVLYRFPSTRTGSAIPRPKAIRTAEATIMILTRGLYSLLALTAAATVVACSNAGRDPARATEKATEELPRWSFAQDMIFPADRSLVRPEDGIALSDGRLIVSDQVHGLRLVEKDGRSNPFGDLARAGWG